jgi:hypothetical protein
MYEPLFGTNTANGQIIYWLGKSIAWFNSTQIRVTLRPGIYWVKMLPNGSVVYDRPITTADVNYTWYLLGAFPNSPTAINSLGVFRTRVKSFVIINSSTFYVNLYPQYANSDMVWQYMLLGMLIVPKDVWSQIVAAYPSFWAFSNDWTTFPASESSWKVASGMYLTYWHASTYDRTILIRNNLWWGANVSGTPCPGYPALFGHLPAPAYMGYINYASNPPAMLDLEAGTLDWCSIFVPDITDVMSALPNVHTYYANYPYYADMSEVLIVPNYHEYLLSLPWLRKALAASLGPWSAVDTAGGGVLRMPGPLLIPGDDYIARELLNTTIQSKYTPPYDNLTYALNIMEQYCTWYNGAWYTKDLNVTAVNDWAQLYVPAKGGIAANASLTIGTVTEPASYWATISYSQLNATVNAAPAIGPGIHVEIGPWKLLDIVGWTDVDAMDAVACASVSAAPNFASPQSGGLGISLTSDLEAYGTATTWETDMTFDLADFCGMAANGNMMVRYLQYFGGPTSTTGYSTGNYGDYRNANLATLVASLENLTGTAKQVRANQIQTIIGQNLPYIPLAGHANWYVYSNKYFGGWPNNATAKLLTAGAYGGSANEANLQTIILGLTAPVTVSFSNLAISLTSVLPGQNTTISAQVKNTGTVEGTTTVQLLINGIVVNSKNVTLNKLGQSASVSFTVSETTLGTYQVNLGGLTTSFTVVAAPAVPAYIKGTVTDSKTGVAISGATVIAGKYSNTTGANGAYSLSVANGTYIVTVTKSGYSAGTATVNALVQGTTYTASIALTATSYTAYIKGIITDESTGKAISGATVIAGAYSTTTAANGSYSLSVANGTYIVTVAVSGYKTSTSTVNAFVQGTTYTANLALTSVSTAIPVWVYGVIVVLVIIVVVALVYALVFRRKKT